MDFKKLRGDVDELINAGVPSEYIDGYIRENGYSVDQFKAVNENLGSFTSSIKRGGKGIGSLLADIVPAMGGYVGEQIGIPGAKAFKERQMAEAAQTQEEIAKFLPAQYESYEDVKSLRDVPGYALEAVGEAIPSILPSVVTGGAAGVLGRGAVAKAGQIASEQAKKKALAAAVPEELVSGIAAQQAAKAGTLAATQAMARKQLGQEALGAFAGSAALNVPEAFQSIYSETGQEQLLPALASGSFNAVLDAITPLSLLRTAKGKGLTNRDIVGAWYARGAKELGKGALTEGATEALQEMTNAAAVNFVDENKEFFTPENLTRFIDAGLKGGIGGGAIQGGFGVAFGKKAPEVAAPLPPTPGPGPLTPAQAGATPIVAEAPQTPLRTAGEAGPIPAAERDIFGGVVPGTQLAAPAENMRPILDDSGRVIGYEPVAPAQAGPELTGQQLSLQAAQDDLFAGQPSVQPTPTPEAPLVNEQGQPVSPEPIKPVPDLIKDVISEAKQDPSASKLLKANNPATAKLVTARIEELVEAAGGDPVLAMEQLYENNRKGQGKALTPAQQELLDVTYRRATGRQIEDTIKERAFMGAGQGDLFADTAAPATAAPAPVVAGNPETAWGEHKNDDHPAYADLNPEEKALWDGYVAKGTSGASAFQDVTRAYEARIAQDKKKTTEEVKQIFSEEREKTTKDIEDDIAGLDYNGLLNYMLANGPESIQGVMRKVSDAVKRMKAMGYTFSFDLSQSPQQSKLLNLGGNARSGAAGHVQPRGKHMQLVISGRNASRPFGGDFETVAHELLHSVTIPLIRFGEANSNTPEGKVVQELKDLSAHVKKELRKRERMGTATPEELYFLNNTNAFGKRVKGGTIHIADEIMSQGNTGSNFRYILETIPYKGKSALDAFVEMVRKLIGLSPKEETALSELIRLSNKLFEGQVPMPTSQYGKKVGSEITPTDSADIVSSERSVVDSQIPLDAQYDSQVIDTPVPTPAPGPTVVPAPGQPYTLGPITKLQSAPTAGQQVKNVTQKITNAWNDNDFWTRFRIAAVDQGSGLSKTLSSLPEFQNGQLRADMLVRSFHQIINLIKNGIQSGIPVVNADGTVIIKQDANNLARAQVLADELDTNPIVKGSGFSGRGYTAEVIRIKRGEEIMAEDARLRAKGALMMADAKAKMAQARQLRESNAPMGDILRLINQAKALRREGSRIKDINREKQVNQAKIEWANAQIEAVPEVNAVFDIFRATNRGLIDLWENTGLLTKAEADNYRQKQFYVPLYAAREDLSFDDQEAYTGKGTGTKTVRMLDRLEGSEKQRNIWENMDKHYASMTAAAFQNQTRRVAVEQLQTVGAARISTTDDNPDVNLRYKDPSHPNANQHGVVSVILDNPNDLTAFQMMHYELGPLMKGLSATTQALRATALINPMYWIRQLIRDPIHASIVARTGIVTPFHSAKEYLNVLANNSEEALLLARRGVIGQIDSTVDLTDFLKQVGTEKLNPTKLDQLIRKVMRMHEASDAATRVAIYKKAKAEGLSKGMSEAEATDYGVFRSRESINFAVRGNSKTLNTLRHMIPFFSAAITGLDTLYRAASGYGLNPEEKKAAQQMFIKRAGMMAMLSTAYAMMLQDDEDYKKLPDNVKDNNWLLPNPFGSGQSFIKIAIPYEVGFLFKTAPEVAVRYMYGTSTGKEVVTSYLKGLQRNLPGEGILIPQGAKPALEAITNYSFFTGRGIEGMSDQGLPVAQRGPNASEVAKLLSRAGLDKVGISPAKFDHLMQGYFAELGTFSTGMAGSAIAAATGKEPPAKNIEQMPFFKAFMTNPNTSKAATDFYEITGAAQETVNAFNRMKKEGRVQEAKEFLSDEDNRKLMSIAPAMRKVQDNMAKIRARVNQINAAKGMDPETKRVQINKLMEMYDRTARQGYAITEKAGISR
jgi:hypothetical protein